MEAGSCGSYQELSLQAPLCSVGRGKGLQTGGNAKVTGLRLPSHRELSQMQMGTYTLIKLNSTPCLASASRGAPEDHPHEALLRRSTHRCPTEAGAAYSPV